VSTLSRGGGVHRRARRVPVISADGQVMIFGDALDGGSDRKAWSFTLQAIPTAAGLPPGRTLVGQAYRLTASGSFSVSDTLRGTSISFGYLGEQVPPGEEDFLHIYFWQHNAAECQPLGLAAPCWQPLDTFLDTEYNLASAKTKDAGLYALMAGLEIPLTGPGWNNFAYPLSYTQAVSSALASVAGAYTIVYDYRPVQPGGRWSVYIPSAPEWANDLQQLEFGRGYWIYTTKPVTLYLSTGDVTHDVEPYAAQPAADGILSAAPSVYYGSLNPRQGYVPAAGQQLTAQIDNRICGQTTTVQNNSDIVFMIKVAADDGSRYSGCGRRGRSVTIKAGAQVLFTVPWEDNRHVTRITSP
jgi:hypothetical protein